VADGARREAVSAPAARSGEQSAHPRQTQEPGCRDPGLSPPHRNRKCASIGFGRASPRAVEAGANVTASPASRARTREVAPRWAKRFTPVVEDAADPVRRRPAHDAYQTNAGVNAGASPLARHSAGTWQRSAANGRSTIQQVFDGPREALLRPSRPNRGHRLPAAPPSRVPLSARLCRREGRQPIVTAYAASSPSETRSPDISFTAVLPRLTAATDLARPR